MGCYVCWYRYCIYADAFQSEKEWEIPYTKYQEFLTNNKIASAIIEKSQINRYVFHGTLKEQVAFEDNGRLVQIQNFTTELGFLDSKMEEVWTTKISTGNIKMPKALGGEWSFLSYHGLL